MFERSVITFERVLGARIHSLITRRWNFNFRSWMLFTWIRWLGEIMLRWVLSKVKGWWKVVILSVDSCSKGQLAMEVDFAIAFKLVDAKQQPAKGPQSVRLGFSTGWRSDDRVRFALGAEQSSGRLGSSMVRKWRMPGWLTVVDDSLSGSVRTIQCWE